jgi:hypothetical protein
MADFLLRGVTGVGMLQIARRKTTMKLGFHPVAATFLRGRVQ